MRCKSTIIFTRERVIEIYDTTDMTRMEYNYLYCISFFQDNLRAASTTQLVGFNRIYIQNRTRERNNGIIESITLIKV